MGRRILFYAIAVLALSAVLQMIVIAEETGNICDEGCSLDAKCGSATPYLCKKSWASDTCVAKGYDSGFCGGKTDKGGYCFECSGGCVLQSELGGQCGLFTTCNPDEYCCKRAEWYASNVCKPKYSDMGCCGGPPSGGDKTTFLKATITNNKADACTSKIKWEAKAKNSASFIDYSADCVEGNPEVIIGSGKSMEAICTSQKLPPAAAGPHKERITWCGQSNEFEYGESINPPTPTKKFKIVVVPVNIDNINSYKDRAKKEMDKFREVSPFRDECKNGLVVNILDKNCNCGAPKITSCPNSIADCVEKMGINDYDLIVGFGDDNTCNGYSGGAIFPVAICDSCDATKNTYLTCASHEIGHIFKLCEEYSYNSGMTSWIWQNEEFKKMKLLNEKPPYSGCGNSYPAKTGIGKPYACNTDCSKDSSACQEGTCGVKISGNSPPYDTGIMGGGVIRKKDVNGKVIGLLANPASYGDGAYQFILEKIKEAGYCG